MKRLIKFSILTLLLCFTGVEIMAQEYEERVINGNFEGSDLSSFSIKNTQDDSSQALTADDIVVDDNDANNHCTKITFTVTPRYCHFIIKLSEPLSEGEIFKFSMRAKTSSARDIPLSTETMGKIMVKTGEEWSLFTYEGAVSNELAGCQEIIIKFGLNPRKSDIFYFDDISMKVKDGSTPIEFADAKVKEICVSNWDTNGDGELSLAEAASVMDLGNAFYTNQNIISFNELQYFLGLTGIYGAFYGCSNLTSVIIPDNVTEISRNGFMSAFQWCYNLVSVTLGNKVETIDNDAFSGCSALTSINLPKSLLRIGDQAFSQCVNLPALTIPSNVEYIGYGAFNYCCSLNSVVVEEGNKYYDSRNNCNALIETETDSLIIGSNNTIIPDDVKAIAPYAFSGCSGLTSIKIPSSMTSIGYGAFYYCSGLVSISVESGNTVYDSRENCNAIIKTSTNDLLVGCKNTIIPNSVTFIGHSAFYGCRDLTSVIIPNGVTSIGNYAFYGCSSLTSVTIPNSVMSISWGAFEYCSGLTSVTIPNGVTSIGDYAFNNCQNLESIDIPNSVTCIGCYAFLGTAWYNNQPDGLVYAGKVVIEYKGDTPMPENTEIVIKEGTLGIASYAFYFSNNNFGKPSIQNMYNLTSVTLPNSLVYIGERAFSYCYGLKSITIPDGVTTIGNGAFCGCGLASIAIGKNVTSIGEGAFVGCSNLEKVVSKIEEPFEINKNVFVNDWDNIITATLYVPAGCKEKYKVTADWNKFQNIVEMDLSPIDDSETVDFNSDIDKDTNLDGNVVGDILYNISSGDGSYNSAEGCIVVTTPTDDTAISGQDIFGEDFLAGFTGIVFKVPEGKGTVKVEAQTTGNMVLKVKIGDSDPVTMELEGRLKVSFPYNVTDPTYVYIYGGSSSAAPGILHRDSASGELKLYGIEVTPDATGILPNVNVNDNGNYYTLDGRKLQGKPTQKGVYIVNGHKVVIK